MKKIKIFMLFSIFCLLIAVTPAFAMDNDTVVMAENTEPLQSDYYFDASIEDDLGNGSADNPYKELDLNRIPDDSIVHLSNGEYRLYKAKTYENLTIIGENPERTIISYQNAVGFTSNGLISFKNVTLLNLRVNLAQNANLTATNTIFKESYGKNSVIYSMIRTNGFNTVVLDNCSFYDNSAQYGGAINLAGGKLNITDSLFINNHADYWGGAIACDDVEIHMSNSKFINNYATDDAGGAFYLRDSVLEADNSEFVNCSSLFGGAISSLACDLILNNVTATNNNAKYYGGAVYKMYTSFTLSESRFENNSAVKGGALFVDAVEDFKINSNYFANNKASTGGAIYSVLSDSYYDIVDKHLNNTFKNNEADSYDDVYQSEFVNLDIGNNEYVMIHYNSSFNGTLPSRYDLRELGFVTPVKNQEGGGNCWAFASLSALESAILKATNVSYDLSEENMKNLAAFYSDYGWTMETNTGGYTKMAIGYLTSWLGPVNESEDSYSGDSVLSAIFNSSIHVQNIVYLKRDSFTDNDAIKKAIMDYGAVSTSIYFNPYGKNQYYNGNSQANHAVAIVGWDDDYSASNFKTKPNGNGAWIIKNSWGTSSGEKGYYYVSYYDTRIAEPGKYVSYAFVFNDTIKYDRNYQYDIPGWTDYFLNESSTAWYKNKFTSAGNEYLAAVSTYFEKDTNWDLYIYVNDILKLTQSGFSTPSYKTIELDSLIPLKAGDIFEIAFKINVNKEASIPISESVSLNSEMYREGISFVSYDGKNWIDFYDLEWEYPDHTYYSQVACIKGFTVLNPISTVINLTYNNIRNNTVDIIASVIDEYGNALRYGVVTFNVDGIEKTLSINNGVAKLTTPINVNKNTINVAARFDAVGYNSSSNLLALNKFSINTSISLDILSDNNPFELKAAVCDQNNNLIESGVVTFNIDGVNYSVGVCNGVARLNHTFTTFGLKNIFATFKDAYFFNESKTNKSKVISNTPTSIELSVNGEFNPISIDARVIDSNGKNVNRGIVTFKVGDSYYNVDVKDGVASLTDTFTAGSKLVQADYFDDSYMYNSSSCKMPITVSLKSTTVYLNINQNDTVYNPVNLTATVIDQNNNPVENGKVVFSVDGESNVIQVVNGKASISHIFKTEGLKNVSASFIDVYYYENSYCSVSFNAKRITTEICCDDKVFYWNKNMYYSIILNDQVGNPVSDYNVRLTAGNKAFNAVTDSQGSASFKLDLTVGSYDAFIEFDGDICYLKSNSTKSITVKTTVVSPTNNKYALNSKYSSKLLDDKGNPLKNTEINVIVDTKSDTLSTDSNGDINYNVNLKTGSHKITITNPSTGEVKTQTIDVVPRIDGNKDLTMYYGAGSYYKVRAHDYKGNIAKNVEVKFTINGKTYSRYTDSKGYASFKINLNPKTYTIVANYKGYKVQNKITVKPTLILKDTTVKRYKTFSYTVKLLNSKGSILKNKYVKVTFKGVTYKAKTNSKGIATFKIKSYSNTGKFTLTATYGNVKISKKITVKK